MGDCFSPYQRSPQAAWSFLLSCWNLPMCRAEGCPCFFFFFFLTESFHLWLETSFCPGMHISWASLQSLGTIVVECFFHYLSLHPALMKTTIRSNCTLGPPQRLLGYLSDKPFGPGNNFPELLLKHPSAVVRELP